MNNFDPTSYDYNRTYNKPRINWKKLVVSFLLFLIFLFILNEVLIFLNISGVHKLLIFSLLILISFILNLKNILLFLIKIYQNIAPISIREKCRFEPSCSNYMLIAIEKYGVIKGLKKGIIRIKRCNINNGGYDYP